jgi:hypothetical protein
MIMIMSMGWDYVSDLRLSTGQFFIPQVIYEHGVSWRYYDVDRRKLVTRPPELSSNPTARVIWQKTGEMGETHENLALQSIHVHTSKWFLHTVNYYDVGRPALLPPQKEDVLLIFITLKNPSPQPSLNPWV